MLRAKLPGALLPIAMPPMLPCLALLCLALPCSALPRLEPHDPRQYRLVGLGSMSMDHGILSQFFGSFLVPFLWPYTESVIDVGRPDLYYYTPC